MRCARLLLALVALAADTRAQGWTAVVFPPAPGHEFTFGTGAGDRAFAGYGLPAGATDPAATRAVLFTPTLFRDVTPAGFRGAFVNDSSGRQHVGGATELAGPATHAILWNGAFAVDLHPAGYRASEALGAGGGFQVGFAISGGQQLAALWHGNASSLQVLDATGYTLARAEGTDGLQHVGSAVPSSSNWQHALLWNGVAPPIDLHPPGPYVKSVATAVDDGQQVGHVLVQSLDLEHAALWLGSAGTFRDLHTPGYLRSYAHSVRNGVQVGVRQPSPVVSRAVAWQGDAASAIDLHVLLPAPYQAGSSGADDVNARGDVAGWVEWGGAYLPVVWFR
jgi:hypothetical protein